MSTTLNAISGSQVIPLAPDSNEVGNPYLFKTGWSYTVFLKKNCIPPSEEASEQWLAMSREDSKQHVSTMVELHSAGAKTKCQKRAVFNARDGQYHTVLTAHVLQQGCNDTELIEAAYNQSKARFAKSLSNMHAAAKKQGAIV